MELKLGSVWLLLSCSLQQSLWGILASVPQTNAKRCTQTVRVEGEVKKVQIFKRIPARCSGWDKAWSWITKVNCGTKYAMDYVELPSAKETYKMEYVCCPDDPECVKAESSTFDVTDEKFLAIAFGSATVALLILMVIIIISLVRRRRCRQRCRQGQDYNAANAAEREHLGDNHTCNDYVDEGLKLVESEYEEIPDPKATTPPPEYSDICRSFQYENMNNGKAPFEASTGVSTGTTSVEPSAPLQEEVYEDTPQKCVYGGNIRDNDSALDVQDHQGSASREHVDSEAGEAEEIGASCAEDSGEKCGPCETDECKDSSVEDKFNGAVENGNDYSNFDKLVSPVTDSQGLESVPTSNSYEHLDPSTLQPASITDYETLCTNASDIRDQPPTDCSATSGKEDSNDLSLYSLGNVRPDKKDPIQALESEERC